jgi:hypothetical protein
MTVLRGILILAVCAGGFWILPAAPLAGTSAGYYHSMSGTLSPNLLDLGFGPEPSGLIT